MSGKGELDASVIEEIRAKYRAERQRRLRANGAHQYQDPSGPLAGFAIDPWVKQVPERSPIKGAFDVLIVGGGFGGLLAAAHLRKIGLKRICIVERGSDFGGAWYWNRYPGAACDVESYIYMPLLEELGRFPTEKYAKAPEIFAHAQAIGKQFQLYQDALFQTEVTNLVWQQNGQCWLAETSRSDVLAASFVVLTAGALSRPKLPGVPGIETFAGHSFHTSRWDYSYTGGSTMGDLVGLRDKRVGLVGTGASGIQCAPHLAESARSLFVFQRTPAAVDVRGDRATDPAWVAEQQPGWQRRRQENFNNVISGIPQEADLVGDAITDFLWSIPRDELMADRVKALEMADFRKMEQIRERIRSIVADPITAEALMPWYKRGCKRPCFHDEYLHIFNRPNVSLVDTAGQGIERVVPSGVIAQGQLYPLDCLIFATGFDVSLDFARRFSLEVCGRNGAILSRKWARGVQTFQGLLTRDFPNCFIVSHFQSGISLNNTHALNEQAIHIAYIVDRSLSDRSTVEPTAEAEAEWTALIVKDGAARRAFQSDCTPSYFNAEGNLSDADIQSGPFGQGAAAFFSLLREWRAAREFAGLEFSAANTRPA